MNVIQYNYQYVKGYQLHLIENFKQKGLSFLCIPGSQPSQLCHIEQLAMKNKKGRRQPRSTVGLRNSSDHVFQENRFRLTRRHSGNIM
ncbi:Protein of unknown function [Cotesia congregata]|uniref:Uncharacterized protein n=1 Tax=Cotesia congregata TaxID=51543 RepID=A0A8J2ML80_COTCN|nr:Protein of unknown function [Cotesia congregata]